ncbi:DNA repair protein RecO [bacterium]|jgi:DNA repair protein RecO|nr:DNA repair protein RecO [bacterium]MBT4648753.1 DNA repair protein RecO [bacterium]
MAFKTEAFVLRTRTWREADRLYYLFTPHEGLITAVVKAAAKSSSKLSGHLPPFAKVKVMIGRGKMDHVAGTHLIKDYQNIRTNIRNISLAASIVELFLGEASSGPRWKEFQLLEEMMVLLNDKRLTDEQKMLLVRTFLWKFLSISGWHPQLDHCIICGCSVSSGAYLPGKGVVCMQDRSANALLMSKDLLQFLREILSRPLIDVLDISIAKQLNREWLQASQAYYQEVYDRPSQALKLFIYG